MEGNRPRRATANGLGQTVIWQDERITVTYDATCRAIVHVIHKYCYGQAFRDALAAGVEAMALNEAIAWLSDDRNNGPVAPEDDEWIDTVWLPRALACGWRRWAIVAPMSAVGQLNVARTAKSFAERGVTVRWFDAPELARAWLLTPE